MGPWSSEGEAGRRERGERKSAPKLSRAWGAERKSEPALARLTFLLIVNNPGL